MTKPNTHGGKRPNAGRKSGRKVTASLSIRVAPERHARWLAAVRKHGGKKVDFFAAAIDAAAEAVENQ